MALGRTRRVWRAVTQPPQPVCGFKGTEITIKGRIMDTPSREVHDAIMARWVEISKTTQRTSEHQEDEPLPATGSPGLQLLHLILSNRYRQLLPLHASSILNSDLQPVPTSRSYTLNY
ncbi:unnamed protein product [Pleuronectes platessa]|uniref:Uncharacterized protein n=1 Tax=Pleuronectes platessa TaxID=8262 RepID=A0A9N7US99_PLEPL|nr:unnamed protein product [Pleuronectes platessa]